jgi:pimeloyl-ACP methyl ester carboxylesterase
MAIESARLEPIEAYVQAAAVRLHYLTWGEGERTLVCLHGTGGSAWHWGPLARTLAPRGCRVVAFDQRGHGDSDQPISGYEVGDFVGDLEAALPSLGLERFDLLGASLGSRVALVYAARHPEAVERLVLVDLSFEMPEVEQQRMIQGHEQRPKSFESLEAAIDWSRSQPGRWRWTQELHEEMTPREVKQLPSGRWVWRYSRAAAIQGLQAAKQDLWPFTRRLQVPTLLVRGAESPVLPSETAEQMARAIPQCRLVVVPEAGHGIPRDNPALFNRAVSEFLWG